MRQYIPNPLRCRKCQLFGHTKNKCTNESACDVCSIKETHDLPCNNTKKCVGLHSSFDRKCEVFIREAEVMFLKTTQRISYFDAKKQVKERNKRQLSMAEVVSSNQNPPEDISEISKLKGMIEELNRTYKASQLDLNKKLDELSSDNRKLASLNENLTKRLESQTKTIINLQNTLKEKRKGPKSPVVFKTASGIYRKSHTVKESKILQGTLMTPPGFSGEKTTSVFSQIPLITPITENEKSKTTNTTTSNSLFKSSSFTLKTPSNPNVLSTTTADVNPENHNPDSMDINV